MSRVGKKLISVPKSIQVDLKGQTVNIKAQGKEVSYNIPECIKVTMDNDQISIVIANETANNARALWGTTQSNIANIITGFDKGFSTKIDLVGVGYRASVAGSKLTMQLGYSHDIVYDIPEGITIKSEKPTLLVVSGTDKQLVGSVVSRLMRFRKPEPYKGKGVIPEGYYVVRKEGKKK